MTFYGYDGTTLQPTSEIRSVVDATPGSADMPGRLAFYTTTDGTNTMAQTPWQNAIRSCQESVIEYLLSPFKKWRKRLRASDDALILRAVRLDARLANDLAPFCRFGGHVAAVGGRCAWRGFDAAAQPLWPVALEIPDPR